MRRCTTIISSVLAASMLFAFAGCKKEAPKSQEEVSQSVQKLAEGKSVDKSEVNAMLAYVPEDSPFVFASTREFDINSPAMKKALQMAKDYMTDIKPLIDQKLADAGGADSAVLKDIMADLTALVTDYEKKAPEFGLNPVINDDIIYLDGSMLVVKITLTDGAKFQAKIDSYVKKVPEIKVTELKAGNDTFIEYAAGENAIHVNYASNIVTLVVFADKNNTAELARTTAVAAKPLTKSKLGKVTSDVAAIGYVDNEIVLSKLLASADFRQAFESQFGTLAPECDGELKAIVADYPRLNVTYRIKGDNEFISDFNLVIKNKDTVKRLKSLHADSPEIVKKDSLAGLKFNIDFARTIAWVTDLSKEMSTKTYACAPLKSAAEAIAQVPALLADPSAAMVKNIVEGISGLNLAIDKLDVAEVAQGNLSNVQAIVDLAGPTVGTVLPGAFMFVASKVPELASIKMNGDAATTIDLKNLASVDLKVNAYLSDKDFIVGTQNYDVKAIAKSSRKSNDDFFALSIDSKLYNSLLSMAGDDPDVAAVTKIFQKYQFSYAWTVGSDSEGINSSVVMTLK